jgi:hypothetical protein
MKMVQIDQMMLHRKDSSPPIHENTVGTMLKKKPMMLKKKPIILKRKKES